MDYDMNDGDATVRFSQCAVDRTMLNTGLDEYAEATASSGGGGGIRPLTERSFLELLQ